MHSIHGFYDGKVIHPSEPVSSPSNVPVIITFLGDEDVLGSSRDAKPWMKFAGCMTRQGTDEMMNAVQEVFGQVDEDDWRE